MWDGWMGVCFIVIEKIMTYAQCGFLSSSHLVGRYHDTGLVWINLGTAGRMYGHDMGELSVFLP